MGNILQKLRERALITQQRQINKENQKLNKIKTQLAIESAKTKAHANLTIRLNKQKREIENVKKQKDELKKLTFKLKDIRSNHRREKIKKLSKGVKGFGKETGRFLSKFADVASDMAKQYEKMGKTPKKRTHKKRTHKTKRKY